jgi:hypothetical protein
LAANYQQFALRWVVGATMAVGAVCHGPH